MRLCGRPLKLQEATTALDGSIVCAGDCLGAALARVPQGVRRGHPASIRTTHVFLCKRGDSWYAKGEYDKAISDYGEAIRLDSTIAYLFGRRRNAWRRLAAAFGVWVELAYLFGRRGNAWYETNDFDAAIRDFNEAIRLDPTVADTTQDVATPGPRRGRMTRPSRITTRPSGSIPVSTSATDAAATHGGGKESGMQRFGAMTKPSGSVTGLFARYYHYRGLSWYELRTSTGPSRTSTKLLRLSSIMPEWVLPDRGRAWLWKRQDYDKAIKDFDEGLRLRPKPAGSHFFRGLARLKKLEYDRAIKDFDEALPASSHRHLPLRVPRRRLVQEGGV